MFESFLWLPFLVAITALTLTPGVDTLLVMRNAARGGNRDGLLTSLGICMGLFVHASISAAGLSVILLGSAHLFTALKLAGACYLIWLGVQSLRSAFKSGALQVEHPTTQCSVPALTSLREGLLSNVLNPKPIIFYMAFLPQFIDPAHSAVAQSMMMAAVHFTIGMVWQGALVLMVGRARQWLQTPKVSKTMDSITGFLLIGFGVKLAGSQ
ncbi:LysE family translocator [Pontibacterium granulatum]|uniref:LysE family translocator n=1 Tax=Pontibacterium granulatum TaxID=2036029 RepID=UPI00249A90B3|nr:LysE family translocator [Pontibacterium granulatum]MDI3323362.1 LysE family translocator [Pontibacterium granulatum]